MSASTGSCPDRVCATTRCRSGLRRTSWIVRPSASAGSASMRLAAAALTAMMRSSVSTASTPSTMLERTASRSLRSRVRVPILSSSSPAMWFRLSATAANSSVRGTNSLYAKSPPARRSAPSLISRISRQMREIKEGAERLAGGDFAYRLFVPRTEEFAAVAESLNHMAGELDDKIGTLTRERNEREAVLSSMVEGVLAVDTDERIIAVNAAAASLIDAEPAEAEGRTIQEVLRNPDLQRVVAQTLSGHEPVEADIVMRVGSEDRYLQANGTLLHAGDDALQIRVTEDLLDGAALRRGGLSVDEARRRRVDGDDALVGVHGQHTLDHAGEDGLALVALAGEGADLVVELLGHVVQALGD